MSYNTHMYEIIKSETFDKWLTTLKDRVAATRIQARIRRLSTGHFGDSKPLRDGVSELRIDHGPGYRIYFMRSGPIVIVLLAGGDKSSQDADINRAVSIAKDWRK